MKKLQLATLFRSVGKSASVPLALLWFVNSISSGQTQVDVRTQTKNVDFSGAASTIPAKSGTALPASCKVGEMFFNTNNTPGQNLYLCAPANTWTVLAGGGGSTVGTVLSASAGQFAYYAANGSTVNGHSLLAGDIPALNYQALLSFTGNGAKTASSTGTVTANDCAKWDANGNVVDAGAPCGSGSGSSNAAFSALTTGTNTSAAMIIGSGASLAAAGTGTIAATSVPASGVTGLAASATTDTTNAANISSGTLAAARLPATIVTTSSATGSASKYATVSTAGAYNNCVKWDASGNIVDSGSPCPSGSGSELHAASHIAEGDSITLGYETTGTCNGGGCSYPSLLAYDERSTLSNRGTSGYQACDVASHETINNDLSTVDNNGIFTLMIGTNDANVKGAGAYESVFKQCHQAVIAWNAVANKFAANSTNCVNTGTWTQTAGWALNGDYSFTNGSTKTCSVNTFGGPIYAWYYIADNNTGAFTYAVDSGTPVALTTATTPSISTQSFPSNSYGWSLIRVPVSAGTHSIKFMVTSATGTSTSQAVNIGAIGTPAAQATYGQPKVFVGGIPRQVGDANSAATAAYNADALADVNLFAGDGLGVYFVNVRNYLCTNIAGGLCYNPQGTAQDMVANNSTNPVEGSEDFLHPNNLGHQEIKQAFEQAMQFTPYVAPYTGNGGKTVSSTGAGVSGNCAKWDANGNVVDAGAACGSGGSGSGTVNSGSANQFAYYTSAGTVVAGHTLVAADIPALSYDAAGAAATAQGASLQKSNNLSDLVSAMTARTNLGITFSGSGFQTVTTTVAGVNGNCVKWDATGNVIDAGAPCGGTGSSAWASLTPGTNTAGAFVIGSGASLATSGTGTISATSVPASGISGTIAAANLPNPNASSLGGVQSAAAVSHQWINSISTSGVPALSQPAFADVSGTAADAQLPSDQCVLAKYTITGSQLTAAASATPTVTLATLPSTSTRICLVEIAGTTSFTGTGITAATVRLQSGAATPVLYSPNQDIFGAVGPTTNNYWTDAGNMADRTNQSVVAAFTFTGATSSSVTSAASVTITIGTRTMP